MSNELVNNLNKTWRPILAWLIVFSVFLIYVLYPILYMVLATFYHVKLSFPDMIVDGVNALLLTGGVLAAVRTAEKKLNVTDVH